MSAPPSSCVWFLQAGVLGQDGRFEARANGSAVLLALKARRSTRLTKQVLDGKPVRKVFLTARHVLRQPTDGATSYPEIRVWAPGSGFDPAAGEKVTLCRELTPWRENLTAANDFAILIPPEDLDAAPAAELRDEREAAGARALLEVWGFPGGTALILESNRIVTPKVSSGWKLGGGDPASGRALLMDGHAEPVAGYSGGGVFQEGGYAGVYTGDFLYDDAEVGTASTHVHHFLPLAPVRESLGFHHLTFATIPREEAAIEAAGGSPDAIRQLAALLGRLNLSAEQQRAAHHTVLPPSGASGPAPALPEMLQHLASLTPIPESDISRLLWFVELLLGPARQQPKPPRELARIEQVQQEIAQRFGLDLARVRAGTPHPAAPAAGATPVVRISIHEAENGSRDLASELELDGCKQTLLNCNFPASTPEGAALPEDPLQSREGVLGEIVARATRACEGRPLRFELCLPISLLLARPERWRYRHGPLLRMLSVVYPLLLRAQRQGYGTALAEWTQKWAEGAQGIGARKWLELHSPANFETDLADAAVGKLGCFFTPGAASADAPLGKPDKLLEALFHLGLPFIAWHGGRPRGASFIGWRTLLRSAPAQEWPARILARRSGHRALKPEEDISVIIDEPVHADAAPDLLGAEFRN